MKNRIVYIQYTNPGAYPPLCHSARILADNGWEVLFLGIEPIETANLNLPKHPSIHSKWLRCKSVGFRQKLSYMYFSLWCFIHVIRFGPAWMYVSDSLACPAAWVIQKLYPIRVAYHEHDSPNPKALSRAAVNFRDKIALLAKICILPNQQRLNEFVKTTSRAGDTLCVWNTPPKSEVITTPIRKAADRIKLIYHGSINSSRLPSSLIEVLAQAKNIELHVVGYETAGSLGYLEILKQKAIELRCNEQLHIHGTILRHEMLALASSCHIGMAFMPRATDDLNMKYMVGASNKAFEYMACGLPLLVSNLPDWIEAFEKQSHAISCDPEDPTSILNSILRITANQSDMNDMAEKNRLKILSEWNYEDSFAPVFKILSDAHPSE